MIHIQKTAPGPPTAMAVATPARLPVPTREAIDTAKASNDETCFSCVFFVESPNRRIISPIMRNCTPRVLMVKSTAQMMRTATRI